MTRKEIISSPHYWLAHSQLALYDQVVRYMEREQINQTQLAERLGVTKSYVSQIINGNFNYTLQKLIEIGLVIGKVPVIEYRPIEEFMDNSRATSTRHARATSRRTRKRKMA